MKSVPLLILGAEAAFVRAREPEGAVPWTSVPE
jgi:hypothetical protein